DYYCLSYDSSMSGQLF
nr:immunoglobulin light chain junction region [Macaca mulatta]MOY04942.1 immunoglobulin light chain junction region [Macaca mulatta]MOY04948.1 immunoglobulin light chain junction region [Macaca mulatta]MOY04952.1 immunoglobulin light chain junction region [Macaca mulatta]MOY04981.1 immunoglobulin light chain junction region [Macaca mulatta]